MNDDEVNFYVENVFTLNNYRQFEKKDIKERILSINRGLGIFIKDFIKFGILFNYEQLLAMYLDVMLTEKLSEKLKIYAYQIKNRLDKNIHNYDDFYDAVTVLLACARDSLSEEHSKKII